MEATTSYLSLRLSAHDEQVLAELRERTGLSRTDIVKQALQAMAESTRQTSSVPDSLFALGQQGFGRHGDASRQSAHIKDVVRERLRAKRAR